MSAVVQGTLTSRAPRYSIILELDRKIRDMELPTYATGPPPQGAGLSQTMSHFMPINYRHLSAFSFLALTLMWEMRWTQETDAWIVCSPLVHPPLFLRARDLKPPERPDQKHVRAVVPRGVPECVRSAGVDQGAVRHLPGRDRAILGAVDTRVLVGGAFPPMSFLFIYQS